MSFKTLLHLLPAYLGGLINDLSHPTITLIIPAHVCIFPRFIVTSLNSICLAKSK